KAPVWRGEPACGRVSRDDPGNLARRPRGMTRSPSRVSRQPGPPAVIAKLGREALYAVELSAMPSPIWRAPCLLPPSHLARVPSPPSLRRLYFDGAHTCFRTTPQKIGAWIQRIDRWIQYANSVVAE